MLQKYKLLIIPTTLSFPRAKNALSKIIKLKLVPGQTHTVFMGFKNSGQVLYILIK